MVVALLDPLLSATIAAGVLHAVVEGNMVAGGCDEVTGAESVSDMETVRNSAFDISKMGAPCGLPSQTKVREPKIPTCRWYDICSN